VPYCHPLFCRPGPAGGTVSASSAGSNETVSLSSSYICINLENINNDMNVLRTPLKVNNNFNLYSYISFTDIHNT
jgi:hypothetical protein